MTRIKVIIAVMLAGLCLTACAGTQSSSQADTSQSSAAKQSTSETSSRQDSSTQMQTRKQDSSESRQASEMKLGIEVNGTHLTASLTDNSSAKALTELLKKGSVTVDMHDYSNFEKVGELPETLPRNDEQIDTDYGDIMLYQGNQMTIFYNSNSWSYTKLGHIENTTQEELKALFGEGDITVTLSLK